MKKAFTILELMVVISILVLLGAIASPVLARAKESALISSASLQLKQVYLASALYMSDYPDEPEYGRPPRETVTTTWLNIGHKSFISPCGTKNRADGGSDYIMSYIYVDLFEFGKPYYDEYGANTLLYIDMSCNPTYEDRDNDLGFKRALAVDNSGKLYNFYKTGSFRKYQWWYE